MGVMLNPYGEPRRGPDPYGLPLFKALKLLLNLSPGNSRYGPTLMCWLDEPGIVEAAGLHIDVVRMSGR